MNTIGRLKCLVCEKELKDVSEDSGSTGAKPPQPYGGGEIRVSFDYGSRYDWMGSRKSESDGSLGKQTIDLGQEYGGPFEVDIATHSIPYPGIIDNPNYNRATKLSCCSSIYAVICDDCFERKASLFVGLEQHYKTKEYEILVP